MGDLWDVTWEKALNCSSENFHSDTAWQRKCQGFYRYLILIQLLRFGNLTYFSLHISALAQSFPCLNTLANISCASQPGPEGFELMTFKAVLQWPGLSTVLNSWDKAGSTDTQLLPLLFTGNSHWMTLNKKWDPPRYETKPWITDLYLPLCSLTLVKKFSAQWSHFSRLMEICPLPFSAAIYDLWVSWVFCAENLCLNPFDRRGGRVWFPGTAFWAGTVIHQLLLKQGSVAAVMSNHFLWVFWSLSFSQEKSIRLPGASMVLTGDWPRKALAFNLS